jgi:aurora kinase
MAATKTLEARFEHLSVKDEKENGHTERTYGKQKVLGPMEY